MRLQARLQEQIKNAISKWIEKVKSNPFAKRDNRWIPCLEDFCLDENPKIHGRFLLWGWGRQSGFNPQDYSWVIYDPRYPDRFQISWKRGNYDSIRELNIETGEDEEETVIEFPGWPEDCTQETDIEKQLEKAYVEMLNQLLQGKDIQISFQKSKDRLHVKTVETKKII
jgi:hypothetical protein